MVNVYNRRAYFSTVPRQQSLTLYNADHFFEPNDIGRYSIGTKNRDLQLEADGALTIHVQAGAD
jgi:hypothetical protein